MNGSKSPTAPSDSVETGTKEESAALAQPAQSIEGRDGQAPEDAGPKSTNGDHATVNGADEGAESEAETLIDSPVKKREAEKQAAAVKTEKPTRSRIGSLPVPGDDDDDEDDSDAPGSPVESTEMADDITVSKAKKEEDKMEVDGASDNDDDSSSGSLSSAQSQASNTHSRDSSRSRAFSEQPEDARNGTSASPNPRKRKHRASSVGLPSKRQSLEPPKRKLRGIKGGEDAKDADAADASTARSHRRAVSTQSTFTDITDNNGRSRRGAPQYPVRDPNRKSTWEESDASSETTSHGQNEQRRPQRGVGRSTSTPGRPAGREHKRHINKYGFTRLAEACEDGDVDLVKEWLEKDAEALEVAEFAGNTPLQIAALNGNDEVVTYLIDFGCKIDCANLDMDTPLIDAAENGHLECVHILLKAGVDPVRQNMKGQQAMDVVADDTDDAEEIRAALRKAIETWTSDDAKQRRQHEEEQRHKGSTNEKLHFMARSYENLIKLVTINDRNGVREFLDARVPVDNAVIAIAAKTGDLYLVNMLLAEMTDKKAFQKAEKPMQAVLGTSHFEMVQALTELDQFNALYRSRAGKTWPELADDRNGPHSLKEKDLLQRLYDAALANKMRRSSSPVTKREKGSRRINYRADSGESDDDQQNAPKRKNGRRLMSRRDLRATRHLSESDSEGSHSDVESDEDAQSDQETTTMKPPKSPVQRRTSNASRKSAASSQAPTKSPNTRRRSSSMRGVAEDALPAIAESAENKASEDQEMDDAADKEAEAKKEEEAREAEKKQKEEATKAAEQAKEDARKAEEERKANELREKEEEEEKARKAEEERKIDEEQKRQAAELEATRSKLREEVLGSLTPALKHVLDPSSGFVYEGLDAKSYLLERFSPLFVIRDSVTDSGSDLAESWVLNAQVAPLLGKQGLDLLLPRDEAAFSDKISQDWTTYSEFSAFEEQSVQSLVTELAVLPGEENEDVEMDEVSFETELNNMANRYNAAHEAKEKFQQGPAALYCVKLSDVLPQVNSLLKDGSIQISYLDCLTPIEISKSLDLGDMDSITRFARSFYKSPFSLNGHPAVQYGVDGNKEVSSVVSDVAVVHEK